MTQLDPKYVSSPHAVNRRTAMKQALQPQPVNPLVLERLEAAKARNKFGAPIAEQLRLGGAARRMPPSPLMVLGGALAAASAIALLLAWIQLAWPWALGGVLGLAAGGFLILRGQRASSAIQTDAVTTVVLFDEASLRAFDRALDELATEVPDDVAGQLTAIKQLIVRVAKQAGTAGIDENFTMEDRMYLTECVRRYLPDSLQSYLKVPQNQRSAPVLEQGQTAVSLLTSQLDLLKNDLEKKEVKLTRSVAEHLVKQQRFLATKARS